ncbi:hypothetical protein HZA98_00890 [Candidatus Woesearchaeota archaeon]|nr:hypothetical protein [Candidatus Woesearchaeota archaeon]
MKRLLVIISILSLALVTACTTEASTRVDTLANVSEDGFQDISLTYGKFGYSFNYVLSPNTVKVGIPVRITGDASKLNGCFRAVTVPQYHVGKIMSSQDSTLEFTPTETGDVVISCTMGMATTTLKVI